MQAHHLSVFSCDWTDNHGRSLSWSKPIRDRVWAELCLRLAVVTALHCLYLKFASGKTKNKKCERREQPERHSSGRGKEKKRNNIRQNKAKWRGAEVLKVFSLNNLSRQPPLLPFPRFLLRCQAPVLQGHQTRNQRRQPSQRKSPAPRLKVKSWNSILSGRTGWNSFPGYGTIKDVI